MVQWPDISIRSVEHGQKLTPKDGFAIYVGTTEIDGKSARAELYVSEGLLGDAHYASVYGLLVDSFHREFERLKEKA